MKKKIIQCVNDCISTQVVEVWRNNTLKKNKKKKKKKYSIKKKYKCIFKNCLSKIK
jgi:hypothetical protein